MNFVGKILVVLIFVMSLIFMSFAVMVYATHKNWKDVVERKEAKPGAPLGLRAQIAELEEKNRQLAAEKETLESQKKQELQAKVEALTALGDKASALQKERDESTTERDELADKEKKAVAALDTASQNLKKQTEENAVLRDEIRKAQEDRDKQFAKVVKLTDDNHKLQQSLTLGEERSKQLVSQITHARDLLKQFGKDLGSPLDPTPPPLRGKVLAINSEKLVEISLGSDDGLNVSHNVEVFRGNKYIGRLVVITTTTDKAVAKIDTAYTKIPVQVGDDVATKLRVSDQRAREVKPAPAQTK